MSAYRSDLIDVELVKHHETRPGNPDEGAVLVSDDGDRNKAVWLPKQAIEIEDHGKTITVTMPERLAQEKGLI